MEIFQDNPQMVSNQNWRASSNKLLHILFVEDNI